MPVLNGPAANPFTTRGTVPGPSAETQNCDVAIIGAGPVGLFAVFECGMLEMRCAVFDALPAPGGQCAALYPEKPIFDIPGYPRIDAAELVEVDYDPLPAVIDPEKALEPGATLLFEDSGTNLGHTQSRAVGDVADCVLGKFAEREFAVRQLFLRESP